MQLCTDALPRPRNAAHMEKIPEGTNVPLSLPLPRSGLLGPSPVARLHEEQKQSFWDVRMAVSHCANIHASLPAALDDKRRRRFPKLGAGVSRSIAELWRIQPLSQRRDIGPLPFMHIPLPTVNG